MIEGALLVARARRDIEPLRAVASHVRATLSTRHDGDDAVRG
jgi:hypothetical protein